MSKSQKSQKNANLTIVIFPYLFIRKEHSIDRITLKPSFQNVIDQEDPIVKKQLLQIAKFFRYTYNKQVNAWSYYVTYLRNKKDWFPLHDRLNKLTTILRYSKLSEPRNNALFSHFDYFVFEINHLHLDDESEFHYYDGLLNGENTIGFHTHKDLVKNPFSFHYEMSPLILEDLENDKYLQSFYFLTFNEKEEKRLLKAIEWFNRSFATTHEVDQADAIIHLETAFEALFKTEREGIKAQVQSGLIQFLGETDELIHWINQFWKLRCAIVHGEAELKLPFFFKHQKGSKGHRHHAVMGRKIFARCIDTFLQLRSSTYSRDIHEELVSNEVRIKEAKKFFQKRVANNFEEAFRLISGLRQDDTSFSKKDTVAFGKMFLPFIIKDLRQGNKNNIVSNIETILKWSGSKYGDLALLYSEVFTKYQEFYFSNSYSVSIPLETAFLRNAGYTFLNFAVWRLLTFFN